MAARKTAAWLSGLMLAAAAQAQAGVVAETMQWTNPKDDTEVPAYVFYDPEKERPDGTFPAILYLHARRGMQEADKKYVAEIAGEGFLVLAPDWQAARFIEPWPLDHDYATELDAALGLDALRKMARVRPGEKRILYGYSRGGYYATRIAAGAVEPRYAGDVACIVTVAGHFQDPNRPEPHQVYRYMPEVDDIGVPILMIIGGEDFEVRVTNNARAFYSLIERGADAELVVLPMARRAFDFREYVEGSTQIPEEKLAKRYARAKAVAFMRRCLE